MPHGFHGLEVGHMLRVSQGCNQGAREAAFAFGGLSGEGSALTLVQIAGRIHFMRLYDQDPLLFASCWLTTALSSWELPRCPFETWWLTSFKASWAISLAHVCWNRVLCNLWVIVPLSLPCKMIERVTTPLPHYRSVLCWPRTSCRPTHAHGDRFRQKWGSFQVTLEFCLPQILKSYFIYVSHLIQ